MKAAFFAAIAVSVALGGCATKRYGRLQPLSAAEMRVYDCDDIELELSKIDAFDEQVRAGSHFNVKSGLADVTDFGIGNSMEKGEAVKSSIERRRQLNMLAGQRGCAASPARARAAHAAPDASVN